MFETNPKLLSNLLDSIESGGIHLPDFQRGWVWDDDRIRGLLASISRGFPIGAVMTLEAGGDIRLKPRLIEGVPDTSAQPTSYLLDGQQRLTSLYQALRHRDPVETRDSKGRKIRRRYYVNMQAALDPNVEREDPIESLPENGIRTSGLGREILLDLSSEDKEFEQHMIPTERLMAPMNWAFSYINHWSRDGRQHPEGNANEFVQ